MTLQLRPPQRRVSWPIASTSTQLTKRCQATSKSPVNRVQTLMKRDRAKKSKPRRSRGRKRCVDRRQVIRPPGLIKRFHQPESTQPKPAEDVKESKDVAQLHDEPVKREEAGDSAKEEAKAREPESAPKPDNVETSGPKPVEEVPKECKEKESGPSEGQKPDKDRDASGTDVTGPATREIAIRTQQDEESLAKTPPSQVLVSEVPWQGQEPQKQPSEKSSGTEATQETNRAVDRETEPKSQDSSAPTEEAPVKSQETGPGNDGSPSNSQQTSVESGFESPPPALKDGGVLGVRGQAPMEIDG